MPLMRFAQVSFKASMIKTPLIKKTDSFTKTADDVNMDVHVSIDKKIKKRAVIVSFGRKYSSSMYGIPLPLGRVLAMLAPD